MRQAIEEGFILDVLKYYTTYKTYFGLIKSIEEDPNVEKRKAAKALARFMTLHPHNIEQKTEVMVEHFRTFTKHKIGGKAKAMLVTSSRLHAVRYKQSFDRYIAEKGYDDIATLVAFSGTVIDDLDPNTTYTEGGMNQGIGGREIPERFGSDDYQVLIAADKFQTGFDQPLLHTMYVDKRLAGIQAVQTLSRLDRTHPGKEDTFVLDFYENREEVLKAFQDYYETTSIADQADHAAMNAILDKAVERFVALRDDLKPQVPEKEWKQAKEDAQEKFRSRLHGFRSLYSFLSQVIPYQDSDLEKLYTYGRFLLTKLPRPDLGPQYRFDEEVALKFYRLQKISEGAIELQPGTGGKLKGPTEVGTGRAKDEEIELSRLVDILNERFGTDFKPADQLFLDSVREDAVGDEALRQAAVANTIDNFSYVFRRALEDLFIDRMEQNEEIFNRFMNDQQFQQVVEETLRRQVYEQIRQESASGAPVPESRA
jgi:type I restriction enzyme R subunit